MPNKKEIRQRLIKETLETLKDKTSEMKSHLKEQLTDKEDIDFVMLEVKKEMIEQYRKEVNKPKENKTSNKSIASIPEHLHKEINHLLLKGELENTIIEELSDNKTKGEHLTEFIDIEKKSIIEKSGNQLQTLIDNNVATEQALKSCINTVFTETIARQKLEDIQANPSFVPPKQANPVKDELVLGLVIIFIGILLTVVSYSIAKAGSVYVVFVGLIVYGIVKTLLAIVKMKK